MNESPLVVLTLLLALLVTVAIRPIESSKHLKNLYFISILIINTY